MTNSDSKKKLERRTRLFAVAVFRALDELPVANSSRVISYQLGKSASSVGANFREANVVFDFAHRWAAAMQHYIAEGKKIPEIALRAASEADYENNIGHPQFICALTALVDHWKYGKELKNWHFEEVSKPKRIAYPLQAATL